MNKNNKPKISTLLYFVKPYPKYIAGMFLLIMASAVFEGANVAVLFGLLTAVLTPASASVDATALPGVFYRVIDMIPIGNKIIAVSCLMILITIIKNALVFLRQIFTYKAGYRIWYDVQKKMFEKYINADYQYFLDHKQGEMIFRAYSAPSTMGGVLQYAGEAFALVAQLVAVGVILVSISVQTSLVVFLFGGVFYMSTNFIAKKISYNLGRKRTEACETQNMLLAELIGGIKQIKVFLSEKRWSREYVKAMKDYFHLAMKDRVWHEVPLNTVEIFAIVMLCGMIVVFKSLNPGAFLGQLSLLGTFAYAFYRFMPSLKKIGSLRIGILGNLPIVEVLHAVVSEETRKIQDGAREIDSFKDKVVFENVNFTYPNRIKTIENMNFEIEKGKVTAIVGGSGAGKSTIINLLLRIFQLDNGAIKIDGINLDEIKLSSWLKNVGYVSQETFIFNDTIENNIVFGRPFDAGRVREVARLSNAHEFIETQPNRYETVVGERGLKLSGGQRQRLAIARAIYGNPQILILDEATSALDNVSEAKVREAIKRVSSGHTVILIAHRLSTVLHADKILVLDHGKVVGQGKHEELKKGNEIYARLYGKEESVVEPVIG
ncbi:MAG: ABC transporter ATP-binding protein/permease [Candidatus Omnitrophica bacterium]|nr:ABC transporter ATP-binding protein/permease [Candidatus Omnitrophota bacterium]